VAINSDLSARVVLAPESMEWLASAEAGEWRKPLDRNGGAAASATSMVKCAPGCSFNPLVNSMHDFGSCLLPQKARPDPVDSILPILADREAMQAGLSFPGRRQ
jgi:hypothetical protein